MDRKLKRYVEKIYQHESYDHYTGKNDISLMRVSLHVQSRILKIPVKYLPNTNIVIHGMSFTQVESGL